MSSAESSEVADQITTPVDEARITDFLQSHPDFFDQNPELLNELAIPHQRGDAVSLVERQVASLRSENDELKRKLAKFIQLAEENDKLLDKTKQLVLELMRVNSIEALQDCIEDAIVKSFNATVCRLWSCEQVHTSIPVITDDQRPRIFARLEERAQSYCGLLKAEDCELLFQQDADKVGSAAIIPLSRAGEIIGLLAIANQDPDYYRDNMSTGMLDFIGSVLALEMARYSI